MPDNERHVEISLELNPEGIKEGLQQSESILQEGLQRLNALQSEQTADLSSFIPTPAEHSFPGSTVAPFGTAAGSSGNMPGIPQPSFFEGFNVSPPPPEVVAPSMPNPQPDASGGGRLDELNQRLNIIQQMAQRSPDVARANLNRLQVQALNASLKEPDRAGDYQDLIDAIRQLSGTVREDSKKKDSSNEFLHWLRANAGMQLGGQVVNNLQQGRVFSAIGGGLGGMLGLIGGPGGMAIGSAIGTSIGGFIEGLAGGAQGAREYEKRATDIAGQFGNFGELAFLRDYNQGGRYGFKAEETLGMYDTLRQSRVIDDAREGTPLIGALQELTRVLGLNAEATTKLYSGYITTGGSRGEGGLREYFADVVGGAIESGFESNVDQYAEIMNSARAQVVQQSGQGISDRAFDMLQDVFTNLTGTRSETSELLRLNPQMAQGALGTYMAMGGTTDPYGLGAGLLRLAGVQEGQLDRRFTSGEQQVDNAAKALDFLNDRMIEMSGMSREDFQQRATSDPNFVQSQFQSNVALQRQVGDFLLPGLLGRQATAQDIRSFEQLANVAAANGGQLPTGGEPGSARVNELLAQLSQTPADAARQAEAERHNKQMEVMSHFQGLMTRTDQWMADIYGWIAENVNLDAIEDNIIKVMDWVEDGVVKITEMSEAVSEWVKDNNILGKVSDGVDIVIDLIRGMVQGVAQWFSDMQNEPIQTALETTVGAGRVGLNVLGAMVPGVGGAIAGANWLVRRIRGTDTDDEFNDTPPGGVIATESYNTFRFAPGDIVQARRGVPQPGGRESTATLDDINMVLMDFLGLKTQQHKEVLDAGDLLQETQDKSLELLSLVQQDSDEQTSKLLPEMLQQQAALIEEGKISNQLLNIINENLPILGQMIAGVKDAIASLHDVMGGAMGGILSGASGTGGGAFASGLFTGPAGSIGIGTGYHLDTKFSRDLSWEEIAQRFDQMAIAYAEQNRRIEFSNTGVAGQIYDPDMPLEEKIQLLQQANAAHSHSVHQDWYSFDYFIPMEGDSRHGRSAEGAEVMLPVIPGGRVEYGSAGDYGNYARIYDAEGNLIIKSGHGDDRRALPQGQAFPDIPIAATATGPAPTGLNARGQENYQYLQDPRVRAFLASIRYGEGTYGEAGYRTQFGGGTFSDMSRHPDEVIAAGGYHSSAAGAYQFLTPTWDQVAAELGLNSFDPLSQDIAAIELIRDRGALDAVLAGDTTTAWHQVAHEWASMPQRDGSSAYGQPVKSHAELMRIYNQSLQGGGPQFSTGPSPSAAGFAGEAAGSSAIPEFRRYQPSNNIQASINVNVTATGADASTVRQAALEGTQAATDEFERRWRQDENPRNDDFRNPMFA
ncbi:MAG: glycoside hydrolase family 104 protein [Leptolyngbya sp. SIO1D8]|nr:glycoside hydrolase family 104 protein [Leptolyngbya sp. SIO1D8]